MADYNVNKYTFNNNNYLLEDNRLSDNDITRLSNVAANAASIAIDNWDGNGAQNISSLVINKLTQAQYNTISSPSNSQLYFITDDTIYATKDYVDTEIANIDALPSQSGNSGKFLTTNGTTASWADNPPELFWITLNKSALTANKTFTEIQTAYNAGKMPMVKADNIHVFSFLYISPNNYIRFSRLIGDSAECVKINSDNTWEIDFSDNYAVRGTIYPSSTSAKYNDLANAYIGSPTHAYWKITFPSTISTIWTMLYIEVSLRQRYNVSGLSGGEGGKLLINAYHNATSPYNWSINATAIGKINSNTKVYGSDGNTFWISGAQNYDDISIDKVLVGDAAATKDLKGTTVETATELPATYQTATMFFYADSTHNHDITTLTNYTARVYDATLSRTANTVLAAPNGSAGAATFRKLVEADLPTISGSKISGAVASATSATSATNATNTAYLISANANPTYGVNRLEYFNASLAAGAAANTTGSPTQDWYYHLRMNHANSSGYYVDIAACFHNDNIYWKRVSNGGVANNKWMHIWVEGNAVTSAVWNDYAEYRETDTQEFGRCVIENGDDTMSLSTQRLQKGCSITSDTWGFAQGQTEKAKTPIAVSGRVLAYPFENKEEFRKHIGDAVCSGPEGTVSIMTDEEVQKYPLSIIGTISAVPDYEEWGGGSDRDPVKVNGRVWIRIK